MSHPPSPGLLAPHWVSPSSPETLLALYRSSFACAPVAQLLVDARGVVIDLNDLAQSLLAPAQAALPGQSLPPCWHEDDREAFALALRVTAQAAQEPDAASAEALLASMEGPITCRLNALDAAQSRVVSVQVRAGAVAGLLHLVLTDITERKRQDAWLMHRNDLLTSLAYNLPGVIYVFRPGPSRDGRFLFISEGVHGLFEVTPQDAIDSPWALYQRLVPEDLESLFQQRDDAIERSGPLHHEFRVMAPSGEMRWYALDSVAGTDSEGHVVRCGYIADITEQRLYQQAKLAADTAERASQAKSEFLSLMSHELRTPLNAVIGFAQLLQIDTQPALSPSQARKAQLIEHSGAHLLAVISDVLDLSRIEAGSMPLSSEPLSLEEVVGEALSMVTEQARSAQVLLRDPMLDLSCAVLADRVRLRQVFVNLLSNAVKYNHVDGFVQVQSRVQGAEVVLSVHDSGCGMSEVQLAQLFEPFNRLGAESRGIEGTGIGLVIVQRLLDLMGGRIEVRSQLGVGTTFTVSLPAADAMPMPAPPVSLAVSDSSSQATVLYAEDNDINVLLVQQIMELRPMWHLQVAMSGAEALRLARESRPDLLLLDMHLGDMSGFELVDHLEADPATRGLHKVALSADAMPDRVHAARAKGFSAYLTKPLDVSALLLCLDEQMARA